MRRANREPRIVVRYGMPDGAGAGRTRCEARFWFLLWPGRSVEGRGLRFANCSKLRQPGGVCER